MTFDLRLILESKRAYRRELASRPVAEKLAMLDVLRSRERSIRLAAPREQSPRLPAAAPESAAAADRS